MPRKIIHSDAIAGILERLKRSMGENPSGEGFALPFPRILGGGGIGVVRETPIPGEADLGYVEQHENEHMDKGWDPLEQELVDMIDVSRRTGPLYTGGLRGKPFIPTDPQEALLAQKGRIKPEKLEQWFPRGF